MNGLLILNLLKPVELIRAHATACKIVTNMSIIHVNYLCINCCNVFGLTTEVGSDFVLTRSILGN